MERRAQPAFADRDAPVAVMPLTARPVGVSGTCRLRHAPGCQESAGIMLSDAAG